MFGRSTPPRWGALTCLLFAASFFVSPARASGFDAPGIAPALFQPDGSRVTITDIHADRIAARNNPPYFVVRDWSSAHVTETCAI